MVATLNRLLDTKNEQMVPSKPKDLKDLKDRCPLSVCLWKEGKVLLSLTNLDSSPQQSQPK